MHFEFATATRIIFGAGTLQQIGPLAKQFGRRALIVTGKDPHRATPLLALLDEHGIASRIFSVNREPEIATVEQGTKLAREENCEMVISFGGGSALDAGKAVAAMLANDGLLLDYVEIIGRGATVSR